MASITNRVTQFLNLALSRLQKNNPEGTEAELTAYLEKDEADKLKLVIDNKGAGTAYNVRVTAQSYAIYEQVPAIPNGDTHDIYLFAGYQEKPNSHIDLKWVNENGQYQEANPFI